MTFHIVKPFGSITVPAWNRDDIKIKLPIERLTTLLRSNISCYINKPLTQELIDTLTKQIVESFDYFINQKEEKK